MLKYKYRAKCSQCGLGFRSNTRSGLLGKLRKHLWRKHSDWMRSRIKRGLKKARKAHNPEWFKSVMGGVFPPSILPSVVSDYRGMSPNERTLVKNVVRLITVPVGAEASAIGEVLIRSLDKAVE